MKILAKLDYKVLAGQSDLVMRVLNNLKYKPRTNIGLNVLRHYYNIIILYRKKTELTSHVCGSIAEYTYKSHFFHP